MFTSTVSVRWVGVGRHHSVDEEGKTVADDAQIEVKKEALESLPPASLNNRLKRPVKTVQTIQGDGGRAVSSWKNGRRGSIFTDESEDRHI